MLYRNFSNMFRQEATRRSVCRLNGLSNVLAATLLLCACGASDNTGDQAVCTTEARASVMLTVIDAQNNKLPAVSVSYSIDKASPKTQICASNGECVLEYEVPGEFAITASKVGYSSASTTVNVSRSTCHVNTEQVILTLKSAA
jgi:hypothetical protein